MPSQVNISKESKARMKELVRAGKPLDEFYMSFLGADKKFAEQLLETARAVDNEKFIAQLKNKIMESQGRPPKQITIVRPLKEKGSKRNAKDQSGKVRKRSRKKKKNKLSK
jgi:hypothetical protein